MKQNCSRKRELWIPGAPLWAPGNEANPSSKAICNVPGLYQRDAMPSLVLHNLSLSTCFEGVQLCRDMKLAVTWCRDSIEIIIVTYQHWDKIHI